MPAKSGCGWEELPPVIEAKGAGWRAAPLKRLPGWLVAGEPKNVRIEIALRMRTGK